MKPNVVRGAKFGAPPALFLPVLMSMNHYLNGEKIVIGSLVVGAIFAFLFFATIGTFTDKVGSDVGD